MEKGELRKLFNYEGREYDIKDIVGIFERDRHSKEIILRESKKNKFMSCDIKGRKVNSKGYLLDERGNVIDKNDEIIWRSHELMYNEPPKIFPFTEFSKYWIKGHLDHEAIQNPRHDDEFDLDGHRINAMGYRIDHLDNVVDVFHDNILFKKEILHEMFGQESEIPKVFTNGKLRPPQNCEIEKELKIKHERALEMGKR